MGWYAFRGVCPIWTHLWAQAEGTGKDVHSLRQLSVAGVGRQDRETSAKEGPVHPDSSWSWGGRPRWAPGCVGRIHLWVICKHDTVEGAGAWGWLSLLLSPEPAKELCDLEEVTRWGVWKGFVALGAMQFWNGSYKGQPWYRQTWMHAHRASHASMLMSLVTLTLVSFLKSRRYLFIYKLYF